MQHATTPLNATLLGTGRRMLPTISHWPSQQFYGGALSNGPHTLAAAYGSSKLSLPPGLPAYAFIDTSAAAGRAAGAAATPEGSTGLPCCILPAGNAAAYLEQRGPGSSSWRNAGEAAVVEALLLALQPHCRPGTSVGIILPYAAQVGGCTWLLSTTDVLRPWLQLCRWGCCRTRCAACSAAASWPDWL